VGKKKKRAKYVSKGERASVSPWKVRKERDAYEVWAKKRRAWSQGKNVRLDATQYGGPEKGKGKEGVVKARHGWGEA
jgi:Holliday junction resolvase-like predicted endonuclease